jgi:hypothetical protein
MHDGAPFVGQALPANENISGTISVANAEDLSLEAFGCVFIAPARWPAGFPPFCGAPVRPGLPYCPRHAALCYGEGARR